MGLNFRKSISILPGVKVNLSKGGVSLSGGVKGLRKSINTKGQTTTTVSIPGTGIYYTDRKKITNPFKSKDDKKEKKEKAEKKTKTEKAEKAEKTEKKAKASKKALPEAAAPEIAAGSATSKYPAYNPGGGYPASSSAASSSSAAPMAAAPAYAARQIDAAALKSIHKTADDTVDWMEIQASPIAPDDSYNQEMWTYYHSVAQSVMMGDIDTYLRLIAEVNPLDDLIEYGSNFEFGTDNPGKMEVEFTVNDEVLSDARRNLNQFRFNDLTQDFVCSMAIRIARDMFALLPVNRTVVHAVLDGVTVLSVDFDRATLSKVKFGMIDPSDVMGKFAHNMSFDLQNGFGAADRLH